jgi:NAD(P)-dependent dehydrogenase (short-subunit alcohol dehydrogenase family)
VLGVLLSVKYELRVMLPQGKGSIINVSSTLGQEGAAGAALYVNIVAPGPVDTGMLDRFSGTEEAKAALVNGVPIGRIGEPNEVAAAIEFLASDGASFITGRSLLVDGGKHAGRPRRR